MVAITKGQVNLHTDSMVGGQSDVNWQFKVDQQNIGTFLGNDRSNKNELVTRLNQIFDYVNFSRSSCLTFPLE
jgi:hypothetical protein